jgi:hypothetical protein
MTLKPPLTPEQKEIRRLKAENEKLHKEIRKWEECHDSDLQMIRKLQTQVDYLIGHH